MSMHVAGLVLGAGQATRMGRSKHDLPFGDTTMLGWVVRQAEASSLDEVIVVVAPGAEDVPKFRSQVVVNETPHLGSASSLLAGVAAAGPVAVMVLLGDMPGITSEMIDTMLRAWSADPRWAAVAQYADARMGHPVVLSPFLAAALEDMSGDKVLWPMLEAAPESEVLHVTVDRRQPMDINTFDDYLLACREAGFEAGQAR